MIQKYKKNNLTVRDCLQSIVLREREDKREVFSIIKSQVARMFLLHGEDIHNEKIKAFTEMLIDKHQYETLETIILFLKKAGGGDFGSPYGKIGSGTINEWWEKYYQDHVSPAFEELHRRQENGSTKRISSSANVRSIMTKLGNNGHNRKK